MRNLTKKAGIILAETTALLTLLATKVGAASITPPIGGDLSFTVGGIVNLIVQVVFGVGILICIVFLVIYGIKYITAGDDVKAIEGARKGITGAIIGLVIILLTFAIVKMIATFFIGSSSGLFDILPNSWSPS